MPDTTGFLARLTRPPEEVRAENLREWVQTISDAKPMSSIKPRERGKVAGVIQNIRIDPREGRDSLEATLIDGTGQLVVRWLGRRTMAGISLGVGLIVEGAVGSDPNGEKVILNPEYQLVPGPEHG